MRNASLAGLAKPSARRKRSVKVTGSLLLIRPNALNVVHVQMYARLELLKKNNGDLRSAKKEGCCCELSLRQQLFYFYLWKY
jgi:hypothetical protein